MSAGGLLNLLNKMGGKDKMLIFNKFNKFNKTGTELQEYN